MGEVSWKVTVSDEAYGRLNEEAAQVGGNQATAGDVIADALGRVCRDLGDGVEFEFLEYIDGGETRTGFLRA